MKKTLLIFLLFIASNAFSQINGSFSLSVDMFGNSFWYFQGTNTTASNFNVRVHCINERLNQRRSFDYGLYSGSSFTIGPSQGWTWETGEKLIVELPDGSKRVWTFGRQQQSFTGQKYVCKGDMCFCRRYERKSLVNSDCKNCGHVEKWHTK